MYPKFKTNLIGLAVALSFVMIGFGLGEPRRLAQGVPAAGASPTGLQAAGELAPRSGRRDALIRHLAMPYVSFGALVPRRES